MNIAHVVPALHADEFRDGLIIPYRDIIPNVYGAVDHEWMIDFIVRIDLA